MTKSKFTLHLILPVFLLITTIAVGGFLLYMKTQSDMLPGVVDLGANAPGIWSILDSMKGAFPIIILSSVTFVLFHIVPLFRESCDLIDERVEELLSDDNYDEVDFRMSGENDMDNTLNSLLIPETATPNENIPKSQVSSPEESPQKPRSRMDVVEV